MIGFKMIIIVIYNAIIQRITEVSQNVTYYNNLLLRIRNSNCAK